MKSSQYDLGVMGIGTMGRNLLLNMGEKGFPVAGYDRNPGKAADLSRDAGPMPVEGFGDLKAFLGSLKSPKTILLMIAAGKPTDAAIASLIPELQSGDIILDGGNSHFLDSQRRSAELGAKGIKFIGLGISGGETGARNGPSLMAGGPPDAFLHVLPILNRIAARHNNEACLALFGPASAGHYVKMVHNGIEYGLMQLIAEATLLLRDGKGMRHEALSELYLSWNQSELGSYLLEITSSILKKRDGQTGSFLVDVISDAARQKGTGKWTTQEAQELQIPIPVIDAAVCARELSSLEEERNIAHSLIRSEPHPLKELDFKTESLKAALHLAWITTYAQGFSLLQAGSQAHHFDLDLAAVAAVWKGGCIIRSQMLDHFQLTFKAEPDLPNPLLHEPIAQIIRRQLPTLRVVVSSAAAKGYFIPGLMAALSYLEGYTCNHLPTYLIQAQRDYFGAHTYKRKDREGAFHTDWEDKKGDVHE